MGEAGHGFVGDQELRLRRHGAGKLELAHLDLGQFARQPPRLALEPDFRSEWVRPAMDSSAIRSFGSAAMARASSSLRISTWVNSRGSRRALLSSPTSDLNG